ncbi:uncharacterized protein LOC106176001 [Lingula anatina]|uniref:Poly [ADP-ribose] polymerase n=1 Tax=Lingula anatina TaxID=7574 RepID=A0A1S3JTG7_LINAN|nr:uncharacterized protein LOC106176001 [Lingula anatina]|eukprot:XP_013413660.1 uncharacterized protein LOC106176001 [Lingula anatina]
MDLPWAVGFAFVFGAFFLYVTLLFLYVASNGRLLKVIPEFSDAWCFGWSAVILVYFLDNPGDVSSLYIKVYAMLPLLFSCLIGLIYDVYRIFRMARKRQKMLAQRKKQQDEANEVVEMEILAPSYWVNFQNDFKKWAGQEGKVMIVDVSSGEIQDEISRMMTKSWSKVKMLIHARGNADFKITKVERVENPRLWSQYFCKLQDISRKCYQHPFEKAPWMNAYTYKLSRILNEGLRNELNEYYFFHGTNANVAEAICATGFDFRISKEGPLGRGIYLAENFSKAELDMIKEAKRKKTNRGMKELKMFLVRACMGRPYLTREKKQFPRPPCTVKGCMQVKCTHTSHFDSVIADVSTELYREFIIYEKTMCYPEYIITYDRIVNPV